MIVLNTNADASVPEVALVRMALIDAVLFNVPPAFSRRKRSPAPKLAATVSVEVWSNARMLVTELVAESLTPTVRLEERAVVVPMPMLFVF